MSNYFKINNLNCFFGKHTILENITFSIKKKGDIVCFLGPSGVGKTTLLRSIAGLEKNISGEIKLNNKLMSSNSFNLDPEYRNMALSFQENCLFPNKNILENINLGIKKNHAKKININNLISGFYLSGMLDKYPHEISTGEAQRVSLLRSLATEPELLLLDEPFANIDQNLKEELQKKLKTFLKKNLISTIIVTHDSEEAFYFSDQCGVILDKKIEQIDTPYNIHHNPVSEKVATFLNRGNLLNAVVVGPNKINHKVLGMIEGNFSKKYKIGKKVKLLIQPEDLTHDDKSKLKLKIIDVKFRGANFDYTLELNEKESINVQVHSHHIHRHKITEYFGVKVPIFIDHLVCF